jgi:hypothetical protein
MQRWLARASIICLPMLLSGCLAFGDVDRRATEFDQGVGSFQNRAILLNLARASLKEPMYFISVGPANAQGQEDFRASMPSFEEGPKLTPTLHAYTFSPGGSTYIDNQTYTSAQMNVFSTHDFYQGFMSPLSLEEVDLLLRQGYQRERTSSPMVRPTTSTTTQMATRITTANLRATSSWRWTRG